jgi:hypothetical protein
MLLRHEIFNISLTVNLKCVKETVFVMNVYKETVVGEHHHPSLAVIRDIKDLPSVIKATNRMRRKARKKEKSTVPFKEWKMPPQPTRYIKANNHDFL